jgi:splicing factor 3A subunit 3
MAHSGAHLDLSAFAGPDELATLGLDRLKSGLIALGLKCGGTLQERAERLFMTKGKNLSEVPKELFAKQTPGKGRKEKTEKLKEIARMEAQIYR